MNDALWDLIRKNAEDLLLRRDFLIELFMVPDRLALPEDAVFSADGKTATASIEAPPLYIGKLVVHKDVFWTCTARTRRYDPARKGYVDDITVVSLECPVPKNNTPILNGHTDVVLVPGDLPCIKEGDASIKTIFGRYLIHAVLIAPVFKDTYPYLNKEIKKNDLQNMIIQGLADKTVNAETIKNVFVDRFCFLTYMTELTVPGMTRKALAKPKAIAQERDRLCKQYETELAAGDGAAMVKIEKHLEAMNKDYMKGDKAEHIFIDKKSIMSQKQLFLTTGLLEVFGEPGRVTFAATPLADGWQKKDFIAMVNEARQGSYFRGIETANGGEDAKYVSLVLQDTYIVEPDCHTLRGIVYEPNEHNYKQYVGKYTVGKNPHPVTLDELKAAVGSSIKLRSPQMCESKTGYCARCMGQIFEVIGQEAISMAVKNLSSKFTSAALKKIHATEKVLYTITDLNRFRAKN